MTVGPRFVFTRFASRSANRLSRWNEHLVDVTGQGLGPVEGEVDGGDNVVVWSLVSGNNRELARGWRAFARFDDATAAAAATMATASAWEPQLVNDARAGGYGWYLSDAGVPEVVCARWYEADRDRRAALRGALESIAVAVLSSGARSAAAGSRVNP